MNDWQRIAESLINQLELCRHRPQMVMGTDDPHSVLIFVTGMILAVQSCGYATLMPRRDDVHLSLVQERGWKTYPNLVDQMQSSGLDNQQIINEVVDIEIEAIRRRVMLSR